MIWKQRWDNGVPRAGPGGKLDTLCHGGDVAGPGSKGEVLEAVGLSGASLTKRNLCSCQLSAKFLTFPSSPHSRVLVYKGDSGWGWEW